MPGPVANPLLFRLRMVCIGRHSCSMLGKHQSEKQKAACRQLPHLFKKGKEAGPGWVANVARTENLTKFGDASYGNHRKAEARRKRRERRRAKANGS